MPVAVVDASTAFNCPKVTPYRCQRDSLRFQGGRLAVWEDKKIIVEEPLEVDAAVEVAVVTVLGGKATT